MKKRNVLILAVVLTTILGIWQVGLVTATDPPPPPDDPGTITVHKFNDINGNGQQDAGENDIEGWLIRLYAFDAAGVPYLYAEGLTGPDGTVTFTGVPTGYKWYKVWEEIRDCWEPTAPDGLNWHEGGWYIAVQMWPGREAFVNFGNTYVCGGQGCTLTPGYWKTHSEYGPAPYDATWAMLGGADTPFFLSGQSYYEVLWTAPKGNAYYILAHAYIAAELNQLNGASIPGDVLNAFNDGTVLFNTYTPADIAALKGNNPVRAQFIALAEILDNYNNGLLGPGHCSNW